MNIDHAEQAINEAHETLEAQLADLYTASGGKKYSETVHIEQSTAAVELYELAIAEPLARWARAAEAAERELQQLGADPITRLTTEQIARAQALQSFVREDSELLGLDDVATRMQAALASGDPVQMALWARYGGLRAKQERTRPTEGTWNASSQGEITVLADLAHKLDTQLNPHAAERRKELQATIGRARDLQHRARDQRPRLNSAGDVQAPTYRFVDSQSVAW